MDTKTSPVRKTYFGVAALVFAILSVLSIAANYGVANLDIPPSVFNQLNQLTTLFFCGLTQLTLVLGVIGLMRKKDSKVLSGIAIILVMIPFLVIFSRLVMSFVRR
jgi:hypothetical protein